MGTYTTDEYMEAFGDFPEPGDSHWAGPDPDDLREAAEERERETREAPAPEGL